MGESYDITYRGKPVGRARVERAGLYCLFSCRCDLPEEGLYRIVVRSGQSCVNLGICVPMGEHFGMDKKTAAKYLTDGEMLFMLVPKDENWERVPEPEAQRQVQPEEGAEPVSPQPEEAAQNPPETAEQIFAAVSEEEPFEHLDKLEKARLEVRDGTVGIVSEDWEEPETV